HCDVKVIPCSRTTPTISHQSSEQRRCTRGGLCFTYRARSYELRKFTEDSAEGTRRRFMMINRNVDKIHTTIGALVVELSDAAFEVCAEKRDAYLLVALALKRLLGRAQLDRGPIAAQLLAAYPSPLVVARSAAEPIQPFNSGTCS